MSILAPAQVLDVFQALAMLRATVTLQEWSAGAWIGLTGWNNVPATVSDDSPQQQDALATIPVAAVAGARPIDTIPLLATVAGSGIASGPYLAHMRPDSGSQGLVYLVDMRRPATTGGDQWTMSRVDDDGIRPSAETTLGTVTGYALAPTAPRVIIAREIIVQRDTWTILLPTPAAVTVAQGMIAQSVADPKIRFRVTAVGTGNNPEYPNYLEATLEPA